MKWSELTWKERKQIYDTVRADNPNVSYLDIKQQFDSIPEYEDGKDNSVTAVYSLPEVNVYPQNTFGDIARSQGYNTAKAWKEVKEGTTSGINTFVNDPRTQFVTGILPLPVGAEGLDNVVNLVKKATPLVDNIKTFIKYSKFAKGVDDIVDHASGTKLLASHKLPSWYGKSARAENKAKLDYFKDQFVNNLIVNHDDAVLKQEGALGMNRMLHQRSNINSSTLNPRRTLSGPDYYGDNTVRDMNWFKQSYKFYENDTSLDILSVNKNGAEFNNVPGHYDQYVMTTGSMDLTNPELDAKIYTRALNKELIPSNHKITIASYENGKDIINFVNKSDANFVYRLKTPFRNTIDDWETQYIPPYIGKPSVEGDWKYKSISTHKMAYGEPYGEPLVWPMVQEVNGKLIDFTRPPYHPWAALDNAEQTGDYIKFPTIDSAKWFTENYKNYYPSFENGKEGNPKLPIEYAVPLTIADLANANNTNNN